MSRVILLFVGVLALGCASFRGPPGSSITPVHREMVLGSNMTVSVRVMTGWDDTGASGWCDLPDAGNEVHCIFHLSALDSLPMQPDGYRYLGYDEARRMCAAAMWSIGLVGKDYSLYGNEHLVGACSRALMVHRFMDEPPAEYEDGDEVQSNRIDGN